MTEPTLKHIAHKGRRYRVVDGKVYQWRTMDDSYMMAWLPFKGSPELEKTIMELMERNT